MRKYDRNAVFNIAVKALLFAVVFASALIILLLVLNLAFVISLIVSLVLGLAEVYGLLLQLLCVLVRIPFQTEAGKCILPLLRQAFRPF